MRLNASKGQIMCNKLHMAYVTLTLVTGKKM